MILRISRVKRLFKASFFISSALSFLISCAGTRPLKEQSRAHVAKVYAKENGALKVSPKRYRAGFLTLKKADKYFENRLYKKAEKAYISAIKYFEKAELKARLSNAKGEGL